MKTATVKPAAVFVSCPHCGAGVAGTDGSQLLTADNGYRGGATVLCRACDQRYRLPAIRTLTPTRKEAAR